jgi:predicted dehydrogenase
MEYIKVAVIGCGRMGGARVSSKQKNNYPLGWLPITHIECFQKIKNCKLVGACDLNEEALMIAKGNFNLPEEILYMDYRSLIDNERPDLISIATRTPDKIEIIKYSCLNGVKALYVEKPLCNNLEDAHTIMDLVSKYNIKLSYGVNRRFHETYSKAKELLVDGVIGKLNCIQVNYGPGQLMWSHPHSMDLLLYFSNEINIKEIEAIMDDCSDFLASTTALCVESDPYIAHAEIEFCSGVKGFVTNIPGKDVVLYGEKGVITIYANGERIGIRKLCPDTGDYLQEGIMQLCCKQSSSVIAMRNLMASITNQENMLITREEILTGMEMLVGVMISLLKKKRISIASGLDEKLTILAKTNGMYA